ncbi:MAG TPA: acetylornithine deacetylase [Thermoanaerobaculia bacterium]|nr:acetylornithine deacetylase [Thermoanaerobaculia bacterium]
MKERLTDVELLRRLVGFDSTSSNSNLPIADFIADYLHHPAVVIEKFPGPDETKTNLMISAGPAVEGIEGLVLSGHLDTVPAVEEGWESEPFQLSERDDKLFGRGTADMKGFLAVAMNAFAAIDPADLHAPLVLLFTCDEEVGTLGARKFVETWPSGRPLPRSCIIGEPTSLLAVRMHKGHLKLRVRTQGRSAHSGYPHLGINAIDKAAEILLRLRHLRETLESERSESSVFFGKVPFAPLNVGVIRGGTAVNIIPDSCDIELGIRLLPEMKTEAMLDRVREALSGLDCTVEVINDSPPLLLRDDAAIYQKARTLVDQKLDVTVNFATDAGWLQQLGLECTIFGPGSIEVAHRPNEFIPKQQLAHAALLMDLLIGDLCLSPSK